MRRRLLVGSAVLMAGIVASSLPAPAIDQAMIDAAKREGSVTVYTTLVIDQLARPMAAAFESKYGVKVNPIRADAGEIVRRVVDEAKAGHPQGDVFDGLTNVAALKQQNLVQPWAPDTAENLPKNFVDPGGYWSALYVLVTVPAINTNLVAPKDEPKSWDDLLGPAWKGKMVWGVNTSTTGAAGFVALMLREYGEEKGRAFLTRLAQQNVAGLQVSTAQVLDEVISGEYPLEVMGALHQALFSASKGAPVKWLPFSPAAESLTTVSIVRNAPHPNAAKLYVDFLLSDEGQSIFRDNYYIPASLHVPAKDPRALPDGKLIRGQFFTPEEINAQISNWQKIV
ncbi:MAG TPA: extracellular solute-binding protein, partial [Beijerinckiaceae bacterium]|nr:extracellular solute-binding protein [Beijerinckiaceae bacterium]